MEYLYYPIQETPYPFQKNMLRMNTKKKGVSNRKGKLIRRSPEPQMSPTYKYTQNNCTGIIFHMLILYLPY